MYYPPQEIMTLVITSEVKTFNCLVIYICLKRFKLISEIIIKLV